MNLFKIIAFDMIIMLFPLLLYLFYVMYSQSMKLKVKNIFFDFAIASSIYLLIQCNNYDYEFIILLNIPLIIAYLKKRYITGIIISLFLILYHQFAGYVYIEFIILFYELFYLLYLYYVKRKKPNLYFVDNFVIFQVIFSYLYFILYKKNDIDYLYKMSLILLLFIFVVYVVIYIFKKGEDIVCLHLNIKELEKDKQIRTSLFKITHEIKNPITVCKSYLDMFNINNKEHEKFIPILKDEINKILILLQDFSSMNKIKIDKDLLDINLLLEETIYQLESYLNKNQVRLDWQLIDDEIFVEGDYNRLSQVFINIIKNALEANSKNIKIKMSLNKNKVKINIIDDGCGMDKVLLEKFKEPFFTTKKEGTGLGVSLSNEIIEAHGGTISYDSKRGIGTTVTILLNLFDYK